MFSLLANFKKINMSERADRFFKNNFWVWYYMSAIIFGLIHGLNYKTDNLWLLVIPLTLSQILGGLVYGYTRMKYGMWSNISLHMLFNLILTSIGFAFPAD
jgi:hypothetical protein